MADFIENLEKYANKKINKNKPKFEEFIEICKKY